MLSLPGFLYLDDFAFRLWAATDSFGFSYLWRSYGGHVNPVGLALQWVLQHAFPGSRLALAITSLVLFAASLSLFAAILWTVFRRTLAVVVGVILAGLSLFGFEVSVWWAAALYAQPYQVLLLAALYCSLRAVRSPSLFWQVLATVAAVGMALSFSRGSGGVVLVFLLVAVLPANGDAPLGIARTWRAVRFMWVTMAALVAGAALSVLAKAGDVQADGFTLSAFFGHVWRLLVLNVLPAVWGGPWRWFELPLAQWDPILANPAPPWWAVWLVILLTLAGLLWVWVRRPEIRALTAVLLLFTLAVLSLAGWARAGSLVGSVAYRYTFDLVWPVSLLMTAVLATGDRPLVRKPAGKLLLVVVVAGALFSTIVPARDWAGNPTREYMAGAQAGFGRIPTGQLVLSQGVPRDLVDPGLTAPYANSRAVFTPQPGAPAFGDYAADQMWGFAPDGTVERHEVEGPASPTGPDPDCGYRVTDVARIIPLQGELIPWGFYARVAYYSGTDTTLNLAVGGKIHTVPLVAHGVRAVYFPVSGPGSEVLVSVGTPGTAVCVTEVRIGNRVSEQTGELVPLPVTQLPR